MPADLSTLTALTHEQAADLVAMNIPLHLPALQKLCPHIAAKLASANQGIVLRNLTAITLDAAEALAPHKWGLHLTGLVSISREVGDALARHIGPLEFGCALRELHSPALAKRVAKHSHWQIELDGLGTLTPEIARALAYRGRRTDLFPSISLNGLRLLSAETAAELNEHFHTVSLSGLCKGTCVLEDGAGEAIAAAGAYDQEKELLIGDDVAGFLSKDYPVQLLTRGIGSLTRPDEDGEPYYDCLELDSLTSLSTKQATALASFDGSHISLCGLKALTTEAALALSKYDNQIAFNPAIEMSPEAREVLGLERD